jgi:hypothetical protein
MGFWGHAFESLSDNLEIAGAAALDVADNLNPLSDQFLSGDAKRTATVVEEQLAHEDGREVDNSRIERSSHGGVERIVDAGKATTAQVGDVVAEVADGAAGAAGGALDLLTNKWFLLVAAVGIGLAVAAPYLAPVVARVTK